MRYTVKIEQTDKYPKRMKYIVETDSFIEKDCPSLSFTRNVHQPHIKDFFKQKSHEKNIILVQHTQSQHHMNGMIGAWGDWELTECGKKQAQTIGKWLEMEINSCDFTMYVSDLKRAVQTAEEFNKYLNITPIITEVIREVNAGEGNGKPVEWYRKNQLPISNAYDPDYKPFHNAESDRTLWNRLYRFYQEIICNQHENIIIVSHGTTLSFLQSMLFGDSFEDIAIRRFKGNSGSISKFTLKTNGKIVVNYINLQCGNE